MTDENSNAILPPPSSTTITAVANTTSTNNNNNNNSSPPETVMAMVHNLMNVKDSRWLQLEVCREYQRGQCSRTENECKFAHPPPHVEVQNGRVTACYDSIKARCQRENPKCKYLHPPQHLKDQLLINGKNNLALKNLIYNQLSNPMAQASAPLVGQLGMTPNGNYAAAALTPGVAYSPYAYALAANPAAGLYPGILSPASPDSIQLKDLPYVQQQPPQSAAQTPGLGSVTIGDKMAQSAALFGHPHSQYITDQFYALQPQAIKRPAMDKSGVPVYQPFATGAGLPPGTVCSAPTAVQMPTNPAVTIAAANQAAAAHYAQLAAAGMPGLTSYIPAAAISSFYQYPSWYSTEDQKVGAHPATLQRFPAGPL